MTTYAEFLARKVPVVPPKGFRPSLPDGSRLFPFQRTAVDWACRVGRAALFEDTGLGKSGQALSWAHEVVKHAVAEALPERVLVLTPLAVGPQMVREAEKFAIPNVHISRGMEDLGEAGIAVANYELLHKFDPAAFTGVVLDESSILKSFMGSTKQRLCKAFETTPFKLCCTATPAPNDHLELGNHAEFLGVMSSHQMIARWFINDTSTFGTYRLKGHAVRSFWDWVCSWARCIGKPSDLDPSFSDDGYVLPPLNVRSHTVDVDQVTDRAEGQLFRSVEMSATSVHAEKKRTAPARAEKVFEIVSREPGEQWLIWVETDYDADAVRAALGGDVVEVRGSDSLDLKAKRLLAFADGDIAVMVTKPSIAAYGLNLQNCARTIFAGPSYSYEQFYQAVRRFWRFGQKRAVDAHVVLAATELGVWDVVQQKADAHEEMKTAMFAASRRAQSKSERSPDYLPGVRGRVPEWLVSDERRP